MRERSKELIIEYRTLLQKTIDYLWNLRKYKLRKNGNYRITLSRKREVYKPLREESEKINHLASHYMIKQLTTYSRSRSHGSQKVRRLKLCEPIIK